MVILNLVDWYYSSKSVAPYSLAVGIEKINYRLSLSRALTSTYLVHLLNKCIGT